MTEKSDGAGHFTCPCATCIVAEALKHEQMKQFKEADVIMSNGLQYYSNMYKQVNSELSKFRARTKYNINSSVPNWAPNSSNKSEIVAHSSQYQHFSHRPTAGGKEFSCPVAIFSQDLDPTQKPMYPKNVVYFDGGDNQLEEIWAARYWARKQTKHEEMPENVKKIISSEPFVSFVKDHQKMNIEQPIKNPADITNLGKPAQATVLKMNFVCDSSEIENIDPNATKILKETSELVVPVSKTISDESSKSTPESKHVGMKTISSKSRTPLNTKKMDEATTLMPKTTVVKSKMDNATQELPEVGSNNNSSGSECEKNCSPVINSSQPQVKNIENAVERLSLDEGSSSRTKTSEKEICKDSQARSRIPTSKRCTSSTKAQKVADPQPKVTTPLTCSDTFVIAKKNPSETYVIKLDDTPAAPIEKETLTLVQNEDDDFTSCTPTKRMDSSATEAFKVMLPSSTPNKRMSQFKVPDVNSSATEVFSVMLPSSTPNKRMSQFFRMPEPNSMAKLSPITEMSRERYSSSSRPSQKTPPINEEEEKSNDASKIDDIDIIPDPFHDDLIKRLLEEIQFPRSEHMDGYSEINTDMAQMKLSSVVKLRHKKYSIVSEIGKGSYARILKLQDVKKSNEMIALKQQKPACPWEFYISKEIQRRLSSDEQKKYFIQYHEIFIYKNGSIMLSEWAPYGSILNFMNEVKTSPYHNNRCPIAIAFWLSIQFVDAIYYLHSCGIIHGDVKPDNFVLSDIITTDRSCVKLIDFGRSIDMTLLPKNAVFTKVVTTEDYTCNEMKDNRPWTYQTDYYGLASTMYLLLVGDYMKTKKESSEKWILAKNLPRYINRDMWNPVFDCLLNIPSCRKLPDLRVIRQTLKTEFESMDEKTLTVQFANIAKLFEK